MIYLIYGADYFRSRKKLREIAPQGEVLDEDNFPTKKGAWEAILKTQLSLWDKPRPLIIQPLDKIPFPAELKRILQENSASLARTLVFFHPQDWKARDSWAQWLKKKAQTFYFPLLTREELRKWIKEELAPQEIDPAALNLLLRFCGRESGLLYQELQKIKAFAAEEKKITPAVIEKVVVWPQLEINIFAFIDSLAQRNFSRAATLLEQLLRQEDPNYLWSMITYQFRQLVLMHQGGELKNKPSFVQQKLKKMARLWTWPQLRQLYQELLEIDLAVKQGEKDLLNELWFFLARLALQP